MVAKSLLLPFDAHNHIQLGPPPPYPFTPSPEFQPSAQAISSVLSEIEQNNEEKHSNGASNDNLVKSLGEYIRQELKGKHLSGMALMATHPRDFTTLLDLERELRPVPNQNSNENSKEQQPIMTIVPCLGVHPWFLHELDPEHDWALVPSLGSAPSIDDAEDGKQHIIRQKTVPSWIGNLESLLAKNPHLPVGEIGLDNFHFDPITQELTTPMEQQVTALKLQLEVATRFQRPVSLHCVRAMGKLMDVLERVAEENYRILSEEWNSDEAADHHEKAEHENYVLPPKIYFHAFGGKAPTSIQLIKTLEKQRRIKIRNDSVRFQTKKKFVSVVPPKVYFGFAPPVNFKSPKTASVIRAVGLDRLVLETDREDVRNIGPDMEAGISWISEIFGISEEELVLATNKNSRDLYGLCGEDWHADLEAP